MMSTHVSPPTDADAATSTEARALRISLVATTVIGSGALIWGIVSGARVILFDGVYTLAGIALVAVSMAAARVARSAPTSEYPFGRHAATPLAVAVQGAALLGMVVYGAADALIVILDGGSDAAAGVVLAYGLVSAVCSLAILLVLRGPARQSGLAKAEYVSWRAGTLLSLTVVVGGGVALLLAGGAWKAAAPFVDPALVLLSCAMVAPMAIALVRDGVRELQEAAPAIELRERIAAAIRDGVADTDLGHDLPEPIIRSSKLGRRLYVEVDFVVQRKEWSVDEEDAIRRAITARLDGLGLLVWANIELTTDPALAADA